MLYTSKTLTMSDLLTVRCPKDLLQAINAQVKATGKRKTDIVIQALRLGLGQPESSNGNSLPLQSDYLSGQLEEIKNEIAEDFERKYNALSKQCQDVVQQIVQQAVKQAEDEALARFTALVRRELNNVQQLVRHNVQQDGNGVQHSVRHGVQHNIQHNVQHNVQRSVAQAVQCLEENVKQIEPTVQQLVQHAEDDGVLDDAAFQSDTVDDKAVQALCEAIKKPEEAPSLVITGLPNVEEAEEEQPQTAPPHTGLTTASEPLTGASSPMLSHSTDLIATELGTGEVTATRPPVQQFVQQFVQHSNNGVQRSVQQPVGQFESQPVQPLQEDVKQLSLNAQQPVQRLIERPPATSVDGLADWLGVHRATVNKWLAKGEEEFTAWVKINDPDGIAWEDCRGQEGVKPATRFRPVLPAA